MGLQGGVRFLCHLSAMSFQGFGNQMRGQEKKMTDKLLKWKDITGLQARNRIIYNVVDIGLIVGLVIVPIFGFILPALNDWGVYINAVDLDKLNNSTANSDQVIMSIGKITLLGLMAPLLFGWWLYNKLENPIKKLFIRLSLDVGYQKTERSEGATNGSAIKE